MSGKAKKSSTAPTGKPKLSKAKSLVLKSTAKPKITKRSGSVKEKRNGKSTKTKSKSGYSLYSSDSESGDHVTSSSHGMDRCSELLYHLLDRKKGGRGKLSPSSSPYYGKVCEPQISVSKHRQEFLKAGPDSPDTMIAALMTGERNTPRTRAPVVDIQTPFNQRLMSSTPDPERLLYSDEQLIPVKDVGLSDPLTRSNTSKKYTKSYETEFPVISSQASDPMDLSRLVIQNYTHSPKSSFSRKPQKDQFVCIPTNRDEFLNADVRRESGVADFQCFLHRESTGFSPPLFLQGGRDDAGAAVREVDDHSGNNPDKINEENVEERFQSDPGQSFLSAPGTAGIVDGTNSSKNSKYHEAEMADSFGNDDGDVNTNAEDKLTDSDVASVSRKSGESPSQISNPSENDLRLPTTKLSSAHHQHEPRAILGRQVCKTQTKEDTQLVSSGDGSGIATPEMNRSAIPQTEHFSPETEHTGVGLDDEDSSVPYQHINQCTLTPNVGISKPLPFLHDFVETPANSPINISAKMSNPGLKSKAGQSGTFGKNLTSKRLESCFNQDPGRSLTPPLSYSYSGMDSNYMATPMNSPVRAPVNSEMYIPYAEQEVMPREIPKPPAPLITDSTQGPNHVRYLLQELEHMGEALGHTDMLCLVQDLHNTLEGMSTFDLMTRVDQLLGPLRNENITLNRRIKTLNQQLRERERMERESSSLGVNFELLNLQADNVSLNRQLREKHESVARFMSLVDELQQEKDQVKKERQQLIMILDEKNKDKLKIREECMVESSKLERQLDLVKKQNEGYALKLSAAHQENNILDIALKQRDHEICRLEQLVHTLKDGVEGILGSLDANCNIRGPKAAASNSFNLQRMLLLLERSSSPVKSVMSDPGQPTEAKQLAAASKKSLNFDNNLDGVDKKKPLLVSPLTKAALKKHEQQSMKAGGTEYFQDEVKHGKLRQVTDKVSDQPIQKDNSARLTNQRRPPVNGRATKVSESRYSSSPKKDDGSVSDLLRVQDSTEAQGSVFHEDCNASATESKGMTFQKSVKAESCAPQQDNLCYSVSDYFKKYPQLSEPFVCSDERVADSETVLKLEAKNNLQSISEDRVNKGEDALLKACSSLKARAVGKVDKDFSVGQEELYKGTELDLSLSTIDFEGRSVASSVMSFSTTTTVDDRAFREGIAALDANIAKVQMALQRTKKKFQHVD